MTMAWTEWVGIAGLAALSIINVLTWLQLARTLKKLRSDQKRPSPEPELVSETDPDTGDEIPRIMADDVLAEEESRMRKTRGAAAHSSDVCTFWDEEDERQADDEVVRRTLRSIRGP
jgi:hypothetical protein